MKNDIDREENTLAQLQQNIDQLTASNSQIEADTHTISQEVTEARQELHKVTARNTAFVLYASELQNRMDAAKQERAERGEGKKVSGKLKEEVANSRKLLSMKRGEWGALKEEINRMRVSLSLERPQNSTL
jgi:chromosome segregation ATPase